jgi:hypothetical protein
MRLALAPRVVKVVEDEVVGGDPIKRRSKITLQ